MDDIGPEIPVKKASSMYFNYNNISCKSVAVRHLNILYPKLLCAKLELPQLKIACIYFHQFVSIFPCKNHGPLFKHTWIFFTQLQEWFRQVLLKLVQWLKRRLFNAGNALPPFCLYDSPGIRRWCGPSLEQT